MYRKAVAKNNKKCLSLLTMVIEKLDHHITPQWYNLVRTDHLINDSITTITLKLKNKY